MTDLRERMCGALGAALVLALLGYILVIGLTVALPRGQTETIALLNLQAPPKPKPPPSHPPARTRRSRAMRQDKPPGSASNANSALPPPTVQISPSPAPLPFLSLTAPAAAPSTGTGGRSGSGQGTGLGDGAGSGGDGGDAEVPPRLIRGRLDFSDLPAAMRARGVGGTVSVRYDVEADGTVGACIPIASSGDAELDQRTCQLIRRRFRFDPSRDGQGNPVRSTIEEEHSWDIDKNVEHDLPSSR